MSQATCELAMSQGDNKEPAMCQRASNEAGIPSVSDEPGACKELRNKPAGANKEPGSQQGPHRASNESGIL